MNTPKHIGIIIDGNRRWAAARGLLKIEGHRHGVETLKKLLPALIARGIAVASIFTFSTENWQRTKEEVGALMSLIAEVFRKHFAWAHEQGVRVRISGRMADFSPELQQIFQEAIEKTKTNTKLIANFCLSYGGREEFTQVARSIAEAVAAGDLRPEDVTEERIAERLYTAGLPDVDLLIRTGGERRLSGFLPWQTPYAELYFTDVLWPDFNEAELDKAIEFFETRKRNFGK